MNTKTETQFGGRLVKVILLDGSEAEFKVRQLPLGEYQRAMSLVEDEIALTALICGHEKKWADNLTPESYEQLFNVAQEVNANGFFAFAKRRQARAAEELQTMLPLLASMSPEAIQKAMQMGLNSQTTSPRPRG
jgi:hypothetical protein